MHALPKPSPSPNTPGRATATVDAIEPGLHIRVDRAVLGGALMNLLGNAFKFTHLRSNVWLRVAVTETRVVFTAEDQCGGLTVDDLEVLFLPWVQRSHDKQVTRVSPFWVQ